MKYIFLIFGLLTSCASLKKRCNDANWFEYGKDLALSAKKVDEDEFHKSCAREKADVDYQSIETGYQNGLAQYCSPQGFYNLGQIGDYHRIELCKTKDNMRLIRSYNDGLVVYCQPSNAYEVGLKGGVPEEGKDPAEFCPYHLKKSFNSEYKKGRKVYIANKIRKSKYKIEENDQAVRKIQSDIRNEEKAIFTLEEEKTIKLLHFNQERNVHQLGEQVESIEKEEQYTRDYIERSKTLRNSISQKYERIHYFEEVNSQIRKDIADLESELSTL